MATKKMRSTLDEGTTIPLEARVIQYITNFPAPTTTQDAVDRMAAELATAALMRTNAEKRYENIKRMVFDEFSAYINQVRDEASTHMQKSTHDVVGEEWQINLAANKPSLRVDTDELRTELIKQGVKVDIIDTAINKVSKKATPATIISAKPVV
jgi:hypothetical protein